MLSLFLFASGVKAEEQVSAESGQQEQSIVADNVEVGVASDGDTVNTSNGEESGNQNETQDTDYSCGPAALVTWIRILGGEATEAELIEMAKTNAEEGTSFLKLKNAALAKGYSKALVYKFIQTDISKMTFPALVYLNVEGSEIGHFAVLTKIENGIYYISDPQAGQIIKTKEEFLSEFGEYAMVNGEIILEQKTPTEDATDSGAIVATASSQSSEPISAENQSDSPVATKTFVTNPAPVITVPKTTIASDESLACVFGKGWPVLFAAAAGYLTVHSHAIQQFASRGISLAMIRAALSNPQRLTMVWGRYGPQLHYYSNRVVIVVDMWARKIITGWKY